MRIGPGSELVAAAAGQLMVPFAVVEELLVVVAVATGVVLCRGKNCG